MSVVDRIRRVAGRAQAKAGSARAAQVSDKDRLPRRKAIAKRGAHSIGPHALDITRALAALCHDMKITSYFHFLERVPFASIEPFLAAKQFDEVLRNCVRYSRKRLFDAQNRNLWHYFRQAVTPIRNTYFERLLRANHIRPEEFRAAVLSWLQKEHYKKNTLKLIGDPNSGKTMIANLFRDVFISSSWLNSSTGSAFNFGNLVYSTIICLEEPFLPPTMLEDMKNVCGGTPISVDVKYSSFEQLTRKPVIITSNFTTLCRGYAPQISEAAIDLRCFTFRFDTFVPPKCRITAGHLLHFLQAP